MSWEDIENIMSDQNPKGDDLDKLIARVFNHSDGKKLLEHYEKQCIEKPCWIPGNDASTGYYLEGRACIIQEFKNRMRRALNG